MPGKKLLVADDSLTIQKVIRLALSNEGYDIQAVSDGNDAVQQISLFRPDVVLIDVSLPGRTAFEVKREVNGHEDLSDVRFVLMSSAFEKVNEEEAAEVVFHGRLTKPFDPGHLREVLNGVLAQVAARQHEPTVAIDAPVPPPLPESPAALSVSPPLPEAGLSGFPSNPNFYDTPAAPEFEAPASFASDLPSELPPLPPSLTSGGMPPEFPGELADAGAGDFNFTSDLDSPSTMSPPPVPAAAPGFAPPPRPDWSQPATGSYDKYSLGAPPSGNRPSSMPALPPASPVDEPLDLLGPTSLLSAPEPSPLEALLATPAPSSLPPALPTAPAMTAPPAPPAPEAGSADADIRQLTASTIRMSGLDDFEWSVQEPSRKSGGLIPREDESASLAPTPTPPPVPMSMPAMPQMSEPSRAPMPPAAAIISPPASPTMDLGVPTPLFSTELEEIVRQRVHAEVEATLTQMAQKILPEIAERLIKQEIHRMLTEGQS